MKYCNMYHFKYPVKEDDLFMYNNMKKRTTTDPDNDTGDFMIETAMSYIPRINEGLHSYGVLFSLKDALTVIGTLVYSIDRDMTCTIHKMGVSKEHRNKGVGSDLIEQLKHYARHIGINTIYLYTIDDDDVKQFYIKHGFVYSDDNGSTHMMYKVV